MKKLIFVYNADSGLFSALTDSAHKIFSPKTYKCNLCKLTYGLKNMKKEWADFIDALPHKVEFLHRDEFQSTNPGFKDEPLPAIFTQGDEALSLHTPAEKINEAKSIEDLKALLV